MVFSSLPIYHQDPPNWHLHQQNLQQEGVTGNNPQQELQLPPLPPPAYPVGGGGGSCGTGSVRPASMSDRARLAKIPQPEAALKCPRCESSNTKFCYFNNYSLSQPRHFCKTCRRYWTRGGALRNVPVGGGCRRNKKSKSSSKSKGASTSNNNTDSTHVVTSSSSTSADLAPPPRDHHQIMGHHNFLQPPQFPFLSSLQNLTHYGGLNLRGIDPALPSHNGSILSTDQWQIPFLASHGFESSGTVTTNNMFTFQNGGGVAAAALTGSAPMMTSSMGRVCDQVSEGAVKMEETLNSGTYNNNNSNQYYSSWGGGAATWSASTSADGDDQLPGQQLNSCAGTTNFL